MNVITVIYYFFITVAALSAFGVLVSKNVFKAALLLLTCLLSVAALYVLSSAEFVAITQILIYAGGISVIILFGIMFTSRFTGKPLTVGNTNIFSGGFIGITLLSLLVKLISSHTFDKGNLHSPETGLQAIGINLMTTYSLPFEIVGVLLLIALIGAAVMASFLKSKKI